MSKFLDDLKNAADSGEFNSEAAKKINDIDKLATQRQGSMRAINHALENNRKTGIEEDEALELNANYEKEMAKIKLRDGANQALAALIDMDDMIKASIQDVLSYVDEIEEKFAKELDEENPYFGDLHLKIEQLKNVYEPVLMEYKPKSLDKSE